MNDLKFNGTLIGDYCICGAPKVTVLNSENTFSNSMRERGALLLGRKLGMTKVSFPVTFTGTNAERRLKISQLAMKLDTASPANLYLPDTPDGWFYKAVHDGELELERHYGADSAELSFVLTDPIAYGERKSVTVPSGGSVSVTVDGTAPTLPSIYAPSAVRDSSTHLWGVSQKYYSSVERFVRVDVESGSTRKIEIDCDTGKVTVGNVYNVLTLDSDWLELTPGRPYSLSNDKGSGQSTVSWYERWL